MRIFDINGNLVGVLEQYNKCSVTHSFYASGRITLELSNKSQYADLLSYPHIIEHDLYGKKSYFILEDTQYAEAKNSETLTIYGKTYGLFDQRLILGQDENEDNAESVMKYYIGLLSTPRDVPNLIIEDDASRGAILKYPGNNQYISQMLEEICWQTGLGWDVVLENKKFVFKVHEGAHTNVKFKREFGNIEATNWELMLSKSKTIAYVGDENSGGARGFKVVGSASGIDRREIFVNGRNTDTDGRDSIGNKTLEQFKADRAVSCSYNYIEPFLYNRDFFLGDWVTFIGADFTLTSQIIEVNEMVHRQGKSVALVFNKKTAKFIDLLKSDLNNISVEARL